VGAETGYGETEECGAQPSAVRVAANARELTRLSHRRWGRRIAVLDDDPTGCQAVYGAQVVTGWSRPVLRAGLDQSGAICFVWTNSRSFAPIEAGRVNAAVTQELVGLADVERFELQLISRGDSTLRGHFFTEVQAISQSVRSATGRGFDGVLFAPAYFEAGRVTVGDVQLASVGGQVVPVSETEYSRDAAFPYHTSNLREYICEQSGGKVSPDSILSVGLSDIRVGGPSRVAAILEKARNGTFVVINALEYADLEIVVLGVLQLLCKGRRFLYRTGPSFVRALAGLEPKERLTSKEVWPAGRRAGHGLVVAGSHVGLTNEQLKVLEERRDMCRVELDVPRWLAGGNTNDYLVSLGERIGFELTTRDVLFLTSRNLVVADDKETNLHLARRVSSALSQVVGKALSTQICWMVGKGGITAHDVAVTGLKMKRGLVRGQLLPGGVSLIEPEDADRCAVGMPYAVFPGNVGMRSSLADVVSILDGHW
jgi:uncharacterized protein YgbK (DUF1537 family)